MTRAFQLAAIDLDGTLLGLRHEITRANAAAVQRLQASGAQVVLASGRHHNSMRKYAEALPGVEWIVSCQGGELSSSDRATVLLREFLPADLVKQSLELGQSLHFVTLAYAVEGVFTTAGNGPEMDFYTELAGHRPEQISVEDLRRRDIFKVIWMGDPEIVTRVTEGFHPISPLLQAVRTHARFLEFMPAHISKRTALEAFAARYQIAAADVVVFGDGENDIPMFDWAGVSVAMPHGWPAAIRRATFVAPDGPPETALARGVDLALAGVKT